MTELKNKIVKCRRPHRCDWCSEKIETGETAKYRSYILHDEIRQGWMHPECDAAMVASEYKDFDDGEFMPGEQKRGKTMGESHE